ncbi:MAG: hypothetical protein RQ864_08290 [Lutibacter sp.]|nr:hypothetical protein [Lutibacter sp.]MDT8417791.1 hypothetical protein [Lutibacter sp.]
MKITKFTAAAIIILFFQGCTKDVDFNQFDDAKIHSTYITTLIYLNLTASDFLDDFNREIAVTTDLVQAPISNDSEPYLEKVEFTVITENTFSRNFKLSITFYDVFNAPIYVLQPIINVPENSSKLTTIIEIPKQDIPSIYDTKYFGFTILLSPSTNGSTISINDISTFNLKSSAKLFFNYRKI